MTKKELKRLAEKIAKAEKILQESSDKDVIRKAKEEILTLSSSLVSLEDMMYVDDKILKILGKS